MYLFIQILRQLTRYLLGICLLVFSVGVGAELVREASLESG